MSDRSVAKGAHLVGSVSLQDTDAVISAAADADPRGMFCAGRITRRYSSERVAEYSF